MSTDSRSDLLATLESQREKIHKYETKLKDLVSAYKSQIRENDTLKSTLKAYKNASNTSTNSTAGDQDADAAAQGDESQDSTVQAQQQQIAELTQSVTDLMEDKEKLQAAALNERRSLKMAHDAKVEALEQEKNSLKEQLVSTQQQNLESRKKLRNEQMDRDQEQSDQAAMMRELQKKLGTHITEKEDLQHQLDDLRKEAMITMHQPDTAQLHEHMIADLTTQLEEMRERLKAGEAQAKQTPPMLLQLQKEIAELQGQHSKNIQREQERADEAEQKMKDLGGQSEVRISELESSVTQLSGMVGNYERLRFADQQAITKLKERVTQLDQENTALAKVANPQIEDGNLDVEEIVDRMKQLKMSLRDACERSTDRDLDYQVFISDLLVNESRLHWKCEEEYTQLKDEFERYKLRAQSVLKNKNNKEGGSNKEMDGLKNTIIELREKLRLSAERHTEEINTQQQTVQDLRDSISNLRTAHKQEMNNVNSDCQQKIADAEKRLHQHRDRTISLLSEKDREIELLKATKPRSSPSPPAITRNDPPELASPGDELISHEMNTAAPLLHFAQESARASQEIASLRKLKHDAEAALHDVQQRASDRQQQYEEQVTLLKAEIQRLDRNKSREGLNLEYLKNVVFRFMVCTDVLGKQHIFNAIATILHFSPQEKKQVTDLLTAASLSYLSSVTQSKR